MENILREKCPSPYFPTMQMQKNTDQKHSDYGHFLRNDV